MQPFDQDSGKGCPWLVEQEKRTPFGYTGVCDAGVISRLI
jgi:hypothetical protein